MTCSYYKQTNSTPALTALYPVRIGSLIAIAVLFYPVSLLSQQVDCLVGCKSYTSLSSQISSF